MKQTVTKSTAEKAQYILDHDTFNSFEKYCAFQVELAYSCDFKALSSEIYIILNAYALGLAIVRKSQKLDV